MFWFWPIVFLCTIFGCTALFFAFKKKTWIEGQDAGSDKMKEIAKHISEGAMAFLYSELRVLAAFVAIVALLLLWANAGKAGTSGWVALSFFIGAACSFAAGFAGMRVATIANVRTAAQARESLNKALSVAFSGGTVMGMSVVGLGLVGLSVLMGAFSFGFDFTTRAGMNLLLAVISGFSLGASSIALFARVGGGIYTKAADVGADLVGKVEAGIPEDDPRNPATIADNVGDNVGDVAGMGADLFESYVGSIVGTMVLGAALILPGAKDPNQVLLYPVLLPLLIAGVGILSSIGGTFFVKTTEDGNPQAALHRGTLVAAGVMAAATFVLCSFLPDKMLLATQEITKWGVALSVVIGLASGTAIGFLSEIYTSFDHQPVKKIAKQSETGPATTIISGLSVGMQSTAAPVLVLVGAIVLSYYFGGLYGIAIAALGMLSTTGIQLAVDAYGPIADNAGGIAEMSHLGKEVRERTDKLDAVGNTTAAIGKGFAIGSAALTALALFAAFQTRYFEIAGKPLMLDISDTAVMAGLLIGGMLPFLFSSLAMDAVGEAAQSMIEEVRRQFREIPGLREGKEGAVADHAKCVEISTKASLRKMIAPGVLAVVAPVIVGYFSVAALGGLLAGVTVSGVLLALFMSNAGGAWDNAKKYIEKGHHGGKGSEPHKAAVVGDTVGDPFKDTAGPALNILIKLISVIALVTVPALITAPAKTTGDKPAVKTDAPKKEAPKTTPAAGKQKIEVRTAVPAPRAVVAPTPAPAPRPVVAPTPAPAPRAVVPAPAPRPVVAPTPAPAPRPVAPTPRVVAAPPTSQPAAAPTTQPKK